MSGGPAWFGARDNTFKGRFWWPGGEKTAAELEGEELERFTNAYSFEATLRELTAEDGAKLIEIQASGEGEETGMTVRASVDVVAVSLALVEWSLPKPIGRQAVGEMPVDLVARMARAIPESRVSLEEWRGHPEIVEGTKADPPTQEPGATVEELRPRSDAASSS